MRVLVPTIAFTILVTVMALATGLRSLRMQMQMPAGLRRGYAQFASMSLHRQLQTQRSSPANAGKILVYGVSTTALRASSTSLPPSRQSNERNDGRKRNARISNASNADAFSQVSKPPKIKDYEFLDCGDLKRLERFGVVYVSRSCPAAVKRVEYAANRDWSNPQMVKYHGNSGKPGMWYNKNYIPKDWSVQFDLGLPGLSADKDNAAPVSYTPTNAPDVTFHLEESRLGQVGVFPEQEENWRWIASTVRHSLLQRYVQRASQETAAETEGDASAHSMRRYTVLNAFAYTGGSTMAALAATNVQGDDNNENLRDEMLNDLDVIHLDASRSFVNRAIKNAHSCSVDFILPNTTRKLGLVSEGNGDAALRSPVRWIVEDTVTYLRRKLNKGMELDGLILDPPAFGRAPNGKTWSMDKSSAMEVLVQTCALLLNIPGWRVPQSMTFSKKEKAKVKKSAHSDREKRDEDIHTSETGNRQIDMEMSSEDSVKFIVLSCHDEAWPAERLAELLRTYLPMESGCRVEYGNMVLCRERSSGVSSSKVNHLVMGAYARWSRGAPKLAPKDVASSSVSTVKAERINEKVIYGSDRAS